MMDSTYSNSAQLRITARKLSAGLQSYIETLQAMASLVRLAALDYDVKRFTNYLFLNNSISGHDFQREIVTLFFSFGIRSVIRGIRSMSNWSRTFYEHCKPARAIATIRLRRFARCLLQRASSLDLSQAAKRGKSWIMFGVRFILIGPANGSPSILQTNKPRRDGSSLFPGAWNGRYSHES